MNPTGTKPLTFKQVRAAYPFPWTYHADPHAVVHVMDAEHKSVPLFVVLDLAALLTLAVARGSLKAEAAPAD